MMRRLLFLALALASLMTPPAQAQYAPDKLSLEALTAPSSGGGEARRSYARRSHARGSYARRDYAYRSQGRRGTLRRPPAYRAYRRGYTARRLAHHPGHRRYATAPLRPYRHR